MLSLSSPILLATLENGSAFSATSAIPSNTLANRSELFSTMNTSKPPRFVIAETTSIIKSVIGLVSGLSASANALTAAPTPDKIPPIPDTASTPALI